MAADLGWKKEKIREKRRGLRKAIASDLRTHDGTDTSDVNAWRSMCCVMGIDPMEIPDTLAMCRKVRVLSFAAVCLLF